MLVNKKQISFVFVYGVGGVRYLADILEFLGATSRRKSLVFQTYLD